MTKRQLRELLVSRFLNNSEVEALVNTEVDAAQVALENGADMPRFLLRYTATDIADEQSTVTLTALGDTVDQVLLRLDGTHAAVLISADAVVDPESPAVVERVVRRASYDQLNAFSTQAPSGVPCFYYLENTKMTLSPTPDRACTLYITGYYAETIYSDLDENGTNAWLTYAPMWIAAQASLGIAQQLGMADTNPQYVQRLLENLDRERTTSMAATAMRRGA